MLCCYKILRFEIREENFISKAIITPQKNSITMVLLVMHYYCTLYFIKASHFFMDPIEKTESC